MVNLYWGDNMKEVFKAYDSIVNELFSILLVILVYLLICRQWILSIILGAVVLGLYLNINKRIKEIKEES